MPLIEGFIKNAVYMTNGSYMGTYKNIPIENAL